MKVDESSLTGESLAVSKKPGSTVLAGAVVAEGEMDAMVSAIGKECFFGKTMALLDAPQEVGHLQQVCVHFSNLPIHGSSTYCLSMLVLHVYTMAPQGVCGLKRLGYHEACNHAMGPAKAVFVFCLTTLYSTVFTLSRPCLCHDLRTFVATAVDRLTTRLLVPDLLYAWL